MSDENPKNPDSDLDENPENNSVAGSEAEEDQLFDVDSILNEEDPDFLNQLSKIQIDSEAVDLSIMDQALGFDEKKHKSLRTFFMRPFEFSSNTKPVLLFWTAFIISIGVIKIAWDNKSNILHQNLFLNSFAEIGADLKEFNPNDEVESFYDNLRFAKNLITISPMHVNLKPSESSGNNPMLAIEITTEGLSADAIIEIKDREAEFKDRLLRLTEEKTYDELVVSDGKQILCEQYRELMNSLLTRGQVRRVLLKSFVIKP